MIGTFLGRLAAALALLPALLAQAGTITYFHNDLAGSPLVATNEQGQSSGGRTTGPTGSGW